ncbi:MAG: sodium:proton antiporter [Planctomycetota bacterium]
MELQAFDICAIIIVLSAIFGFINTKLLKLPNTIGLMIVAIAFTMIIFLSSLFSDFFLEAARQLISNIDFQHVLLEIMLGFLLFAGAIHTNFDQLRVQRWPILVFATLGVLSSTFLCAILVLIAFNLIGVQVKFIECLLFGALISPTDPIAVLGILKGAGVPKKLETKIVGESLFNDGVGVVVFLTIFHIATGGSHPGSDPSHHQHSATTHSVISVEEQADNAGGQLEDENLDERVANDQNQNKEVQHLHENSAGKPNFWLGIFRLFGQEVLGGLGLGLACGYVTFLLLRSIDDYEIEVLITLACVTGGYALASSLHLSAPLAIVVAGLVVGNDTVRGTAMSQQTEMYVDKFWELMDILFNSVLFVLIGLEILLLSVTSQSIYASIIAIVIVLFARYMSLIAPVRFFSKKLDFVPHTATIMAWGGLRGGISIALALLLPTDLNRDLFLTVTYGVVIFSIIVQGLTVGKMAKRLIGSESIQQA